MPLPFRIVAVQGVVALALASTFALRGRAHAMAVVLAALVMIVPSVLFAWRVSAANVPVGRELSAARRLLGSGIAKSLVTVALLAGVFAELRPEPLPFFVTMLALQSVFWFAPLFGSDP